VAYKDKEQQRKATREAVARHRKGITSKGQGITLSGVKGITSHQGITPKVIPGLTLPEKLIDPAWRERLTKISNSLSAFNVADRVRLGVSGPSFDVVGELLELTAQDGHKRAVKKA